MRIFLSILITVTPFFLFAQEEESNYGIVDSFYREDQLYAGVTFNLLSNGPEAFSQNGLSAGVQAGFIRDFPINKRRNKAFGIGVGISIDTYNQNLIIREDLNNSDSVYEIIAPSINEEENRFTSYTVEIPIEYRWRTSTPTKYSFWRIHAGIKLGHIFSFESNFTDNGETIKRTDISEVNKFQYGPSFSFGYGAFNFQAYYGFNTLFNEDAKVEDEEVNLQVVKLGLIFYFL